MDEKLLREIEEVATASTPAPLAWGIHPAATVDEAAAWMAESIRKCPGTTVHMVVQGSPGQEIADGKVTAYTGNGPTSEANAIFYAGAREAALLLVAEVRRLGKIEVAARAVLADLEPHWVIYPGSTHQLWLLKKALEGDDASPPG